MSNAFEGSIDSSEPRIDFAHVEVDEFIDPELVPLVPTHLTPTQWLLTGRTGKNVRVCIIDSGIDFSHPAVPNSGKSFVLTEDNAGSRMVIPGAAADAVGHGTACASIIGAWASDAALDSVRVLGARNVGRAQDFLVALEWAIEERYDVINLSLSTRRPEHRHVLLDLADRAASAGVVLVCAAHNSPVVSFPWSLASVISVGSHRSPDPYEVHVNPTPPVDFFAGGVAVRVAWLDSGFRRVSGNSFAAPAIVANLVRIIEAQPGLQPWQYKYLLSLLAIDAGSRDSGAAPNATSGETR